MNFLPLMVIATQLKLHNHSLLGNFLDFQGYSKYHGASRPSIASYKYHFNASLDLINNLAGGKLHIMPREKEAHLY